jgi:hypothetical protein
MEAMADDFYGDFGRFLRQGTIGSAAAVLVAPAEPEIGQRIAVQCKGVFAGRLTASTGEHWDVEDGTVLHMPIFRRMSFTLSDGLGEPHAHAEVHPHVAIPHVTRWSLPRIARCGQGHLGLELEAANAQSISYAWRNASEPHWHEVPPEDRVVPLPDQPGRLAVRATLSSRHAALSPQATVVVERWVDVVHPDVEWTHELLGSLVRCSCTLLRIRVRHAISCQIAVGDERLGEAVAVPSRGLVLEAPVPTTACGPISVNLHFIDLNGRAVVRALTLRVMPRVASCHIHELGPDTWGIEISGARPLRLRVPSRGLSLPLAGERSLVRCAAMLPTLAEVSWEDDLGNIHARTVELGGSAHRWTALPQMKQVRWNT